MLNKEGVSGKKRKVDKVSHKLLIDIFGNIKHNLERSKGVCIYIDRDINECLGSFFFLGEALVINDAN